MFPSRPLLIRERHKPAKGYPQLPHFAVFLSNCGILAAFLVPSVWNFLTGQQPTDGQSSWPGSGIAFAQQG
jgi:hypothetical protein